MPKAIKSPSFAQEPITGTLAVLRFELNLVTNRILKRANAEL